MRGWAFQIISALLICAAFALPACNKTENPNFQSDADVYRFKHLRYYGEKIEAYKAKTGSYPFMDEADVLPVYAVIASPEQVDDVSKLPFEHISKSTKDFINELETGLGVTLDEYYDPQYAFNKKPNFYIYMASQGRYFFAIHVSQPYDFAQTVGDGYYKIEISNDPRKDSYASHPNALFSHDPFIAAENGVVSKPEFFEAREKKFLHATKQADK